jgi:hypothetical protein
MEQCRFLNLKTFSGEHFLLKAYCSYTADSKAERRRVQLFLIKWQGASILVKISVSKTFSTSRKWDLEIHVEQINNAEFNCGRNAAACR